MLILARKEGDDIIVYDARTGQRIIRIVIVRAKGQVKVGVEGPLFFNVVRGELDRPKKEEGGQDNEE